MGKRGTPEPEANEVSLASESILLEIWSQKITIVPLLPMDLFILLANLNKFWRHEVRLFLVQKGYDDYWKIDFYTIWVLLSNIPDNGLSLPILYPSGQATPKRRKVKTHIKLNSPLTHFMKNEFFHYFHCVDQMGIALEQDRLDLLKETVSRIGPFTFAIPSTATGWYALVEVLATDWKLRRFPEQIVLRLEQELRNDPQELFGESLKFDLCPFTLEDYIQCGRRAHVSTLIPILKRTFVGKSKTEERIYEELIQLRGKLVAANCYDVDFWKIEFFRDLLTGGYGFDNAFLNAFARVLHQSGYIGIDIMMEDEIHVNFVDRNKESVYPFTFRNVAVDKVSVILVRYQYPDKNKVFTFGTLLDIFYSAKFLRTKCLALLRLAQLWRDLSSAECQSSRDAFTLKLVKYYSKKQPIFGDRCAPEISATVLEHLQTKWGIMDISILPEFINSVSWPQTPLQK